MAKVESSDQQKTEADEQSEKDQAGAGTSGVDEDEGTEAEETEEGDEEAEEGDEDEDDDEGELSLLSEAELKKYEGKPAEMMKALNKAATKKFQQLSRERKELRPYRNLISALNEKPKDAIAALAEQFGVEVVKKRGSTEEAVETVAQKVGKVVAEALGEEYGDLAPRLTKAIHDAAELVVADKVKDTDAKVTEVIADAALAEANAAVAALEERHPDWKKYEKRMMGLSQRMPPGEGMDQLEYLENLYYLVSREGATGDGIKRAVKRMAKAAGNSEKKDAATVDSKVVTISPGKLPTFKEAADAARRNERLE